MKPSNKDSQLKKVSEMLIESHNDAVETLNMNHEISTHINKIADAVTESGVSDREKLYQAICEVIWEDSVS